MQAIAWALKQKVDIISMSISMLDPGLDPGRDPGRDGGLQKEAFEAADKGVIIVCSTHDEGTRTTTSYPAGWKKLKDNIIVITACDEYGHLLRDFARKDEDNFTYKLQGQNVAASVIPFVESSDSISGSSVSTALAAGLSSLILTCDKLARLGEKEPETENQQYGPGDKKAVEFQYTKGQADTVRKHLDSMAPNAHLLLEKFGNIDSTTLDGEEIDARKILQNSFSMKNYRILPAEMEYRGAGTEPR